MKSDGEKIRVLLIEDSTTQAMLCRSILEKAGYQVESAPDAEKGLDLIGQTAFDLVLSDINLPGLSGFELCTQIRSDPEVSELPVILATQLSHPEEILKGLQAGANSFVIKPYRSEALIHRIETILGGRMLHFEETLEVSCLGERFQIAGGRELILDYLVTILEEMGNQ